MTEDIAKLRPGDPHPRAYVGPPGQYDFMGATQFRLLTALGLREEHSVLDFGCGSLRAGRLLLPFLQPGNYCGIDPNKWLIDAAIEKELGREFIALRRARFDYNDQFKFDVFGQAFDFVVLQSILSHTGKDLFEAALRNAQAALHQDSRLLVTVLHEEHAGTSFKPGQEATGWIYPHCVWYSRSEFSEHAQNFGYAAQQLPWYHPRQTWWLLTRDKRNLLGRLALSALDGLVLNDPRFQV